VLENPDSFCPDFGHLMCSKIPESFGQMRENHEKWGPENEQFLDTYNWQFVSGIQPLIVLENPDSLCPDSGHLMCSKIPASCGQMRENHEKWGPENEQLQFMDT
jgi:hypothetical protein